MGTLEPLPLKLTVTCGFTSASLRITTAPFTSPSAAGVNVTVTSNSSPEATSSGPANGSLRAKPTSPPSLTCTSDTLSATSPGLSIVNTNSELSPKNTAPNSSTSGVTSISTGIGKPLPVQGTWVGEVGALLKICSDPFASPSSDGAKVKSTLRDSPGFSVVISTGASLAENASPVTVTLEMSSVAVPSLVMVTDATSLSPSTTPPKSTAAGTTVITGAVPLPLSGSSA